MRVAQYAYFALKSERVTAAEITARLGVEPDEIMVRGSRLASPPRPVTHSWQVACRAPDLPVDRQIERIVDRLFEHAAAIGELVGDEVGSVLQVVRVLEDPAGAEEDTTSPVAGLEKLAGQHQLLGWHLDARMLEFLRLTRAELDVDEYAYG